MIDFLEAVAARIAADQKATGRKPYEYLPDDIVYFCELEIKQRLSELPRHVMRGVIDGREFIWAESIDELAQVPCKGCGE